MAFVFAGNDPYSPKRYFLTSDLRNITSCCINTVNGRLLSPVVTVNIPNNEDDELPPYVLRSQNVYKLVGNGEMLKIVSRNSENEDAERELTTDLFCTCFTYYKKSLSKRFTRRFRVPSNLYYFVSPNLDYAILINQSVFEDRCSFSVRTFDQTIYRKTTKGMLFKDLHYICTKNKIVFRPATDFSLDSRIFCCVTNGLLKSAVDNHQQFCFIDVFFCQKENDNKSIDFHHILNFDASADVKSYREVLACHLNVTADKILVLFREHYLFFSITKTHVVASGLRKNMTDDVKWVYDVVHGELIVNVDIISYNINIYKLDFSSVDCLTVYRNFSIAEYFPNDLTLFSTRLSEVSTGIVRVFVADFNKVLVIDPFSMTCVCTLSLPYRQNYIVGQILVNWPGSEVLVVERYYIKKEESETPPVLSIFKLGWRTDVFTLKFISAVSVMSGYSKMDLQKLNLPKNLRYYLNLSN